jgi:hypothetical protein
MTKKKLNPEAEKEVSALRERLVLTLRFIQEAGDDFPNCDQWLELVDNAATNGELRTLRLLVREVNELVATLTRDQMNDLRALLQARLGVDMDAERRDLQLQIARALKRGTIASEKERRRLEEYVEMLEVNGGNQAQIEKIEQLLRSG